MRSAQDFTADVTTRGRDGYVRYSEGSHSHDFYWEFCGAGCVASAGIPTEQTWAVELPWAADRRDVVIARVGEAMCRQAGAGCAWRVEKGWLEILAATGR